MKSILMSTIVLMIAFFAGCKSYDKAAYKVQKTAYVVIAAVENGFAGKCVGSKKDYTKMASKLKPCSKVQVKLLDKTATKNAILNALSEGVKNELLIFYFSGHGAQGKAYYDTTEVDSKDEYIMAYDAAISDNEIWNIISKSKGRVMLIFDSCHSQTMYKAPMTFMKQKMMMKATSNVNGPINMICWSGCADDKESFGSSAGGFLTRAICSAYNKNKTYDEVWAKVEKNTTLKKKQVAQCTKMGKDFGTSKIFQ